MPSESLNIKQNEFNSAMKKYHEITYYQATYKIISFVNISLEIMLLFILTTLALEAVWILPLLFIAYFIADFLNGFIHLYMDNNDSYTSFFGVFIASFHLHHKTPQYKNKNIFLIYYNESGMKFWLIPYLLFVLALSFLEINDYILAFFILVGILSSVAEVSHFLCHNSNSKIVLLLQKSGVLLSMKHHEKHHNEDNKGYAFLNGMSDFLIDKIAKRFYSGYKENADKHSENYMGEETANRV